MGTHYAIRDVRDGRIFLCAELGIIRGFEDLLAKGTPEQLRKKFPAIIDTTEKKEV